MERDNKSCLCDKSYTHKNKSFICEQCNTMRCQECWITDDQGTYFCPYCFCTPKDNSPIIAYSFIDTNKIECCVCFDEISYFIVMGCGHGTCLSCYIQLLQKQKNEEIYSLPILSHKLLDDDIYDSSYLLSSCIQCNVAPDRYIQFIVNKQIIPPEREKIDKWNLYNIFEYITKSGLFDKNTLIKSIMQYRLFIQAKVDVNDINATKISPSPLIDTIWHTHILFTQDYANFCYNLIKSQINHNPMGEFDKDDKHKRYKAMLEWMILNGHCIDESIWIPSNYKDMILDDSHDKFEIFVKAPTGNIYIALVSKYSKIWELKAWMYYKTNIKISDQKMVYERRSLNNLDTLGKYNITGDVTLYITLNIRGC